MIKGEASWMDSGGRIWLSYDPPNTQVVQISRELLDNLISEINYLNREVERLTQEVYYRD